MTFTPGPWKYRELNADGAIVTKGGCFEISTPGYDVVAHIPKAAPIRKEADARLIAAAPDLLEALENLYELWRGQVDWQGELESINKPIEALIARATGEN